MYSGVDGREFEADIFMGVIYYQRLRHMVSDKFQIRTTGPIDTLTRQPVKGRKKHGGVRFGEMERDGLLSHGTSFLLQDRLFINSDRSLVRESNYPCAFRRLITIPVAGARVYQVRQHPHAHPPETGQQRGGHVVAAATPSHVRQVRDDGHHPDGRTALRLPLPVRRARRHEHQRQDGGATCVAHLRFCALARIFSCGVFLTISLLSFVLISNHV